MGILDKLAQLQESIKTKKSGDEDLFALFESLKEDIAEHERQLEILSVAGAELSKEQDQTSALALILYTARNLTNADAGTVYSVSEEYHDYQFNPGELKSKHLVFEELHTESKNDFKTRPDWPPVPMEIDGKPNEANVCAYCANTGSILNIPDVYNEEGFDFQGAKNYDANNNYRSKSMLVLPLRDHENEINGVLQLINRQAADGRSVPFTRHDQTIVQAMSYQAAISLTTQTLLRAQIELFNSFVRVLAEGLGEKSPYTYGHINRVAELSFDLAKSIDQWQEGMYKQVRFNQYQLDEIQQSGWMHDIGKLTTPEHVVSKPIKLFVLSDRFETIIERFNAKLKDVEISYLNEKISGLEKNAPPEYFTKIETEKNRKKEDLINDLKVLNRTNTGGEFLEDKKRDLVIRYNQETFDQMIHADKSLVMGENRITSVNLLESPAKASLVDEEEKQFLLISKGTLSNEERMVINDHADRSWRWLMKLPFPKKMMKLPLYAAAHHETLKGTGYPNRLKDHELPIQSRIIAVADIYEALTANDRPYKTPMKLSQALDILGKMVIDYDLDAEVVKIFLKSGLYKKYAEQFLDKEQIETIDVDEWLAKYYPDKFSDTLPN